MVPADTVGSSQELAESIAEFIRAQVAQSPANSLSLLDGSPVFEEPLVGFACGEDPLFQEYKRIIGPFHFIPREMLEQSLEAERITSPSVAGTSVVCWALPIARNIRSANRREDRGPSPAWADTKYDGEKFNNSLRSAVVFFLRERGHRAVAPLLSPLFAMSLEPSGGLTSNWSERHALYVAGMGTFGLSDGFITERGIAMRCGSVVTDVRLPPSPRKYSSHTDNCPFFSDGSCGVCIDRCPAGAISDEGHDKAACFEYLNEDLAWAGERYGQNPLACGLCQTAVPCESRIPPSSRTLTR